MDAHPLSITCLRCLPNVTAPRRHSPVFIFYCFSECQMVSSMKTNTLCPRGITKCHCKFKKQYYLPISLVSQNARWYVPCEKKINVAVESQNATANSTNTVQYYLPVSLIALLTVGVHAWQTLKMPPTEAVIYEPGTPGLHLPAHARDVLARSRFSGCVRYVLLEHHHHCESTHYISVFFHTPVEALARLG